MSSSTVNETVTENRHIKVYSPEGEHLLSQAAAEVKALVNASEISKARSEMAFIDTKSILVAREGFRVSLNLEFLAFSRF